MPEKMSLPRLEDEDIMMLVSMANYVRKFSRDESSGILNDLSLKMQACVDWAQYVESVLESPILLRGVPDRMEVIHALRTANVVIFGFRLQQGDADKVEHSINSVSIVPVSHNSAVICGSLDSQKDYQDLGNLPFEDAVSFIFRLVASSSQALTLTSGENGEVNVSSEIASNGEINVNSDNAKIFACWIGRRRVEPFCRSQIVGDPNPEHSDSERQALEHEKPPQTSLEIIEIETFVGPPAINFAPRADAFWKVYDVDVDSANNVNQDVEDDVVVIERHEIPPSLAVEDVHDNYPESELHKRELIPLENGVLPVVVSKVKSVIPSAYHSARLGFIFGCMAAYLDDQKLPSEKVEEVLFQTFTSAMSGSMSRTAGLLFATSVAEGGAVPRMAVLKASTFTYAVSLSVNTIYDAILYARGKQTQVELRRNLAANSFGGIGSMLAGATTAATVTFVGGAAAATTWPAAATASLAGVAGGMCGGFAGRAADSAVFNARLDEAVHAYQFFGWPIRRRGPRPVKSAEEIAAAYARRVAEKPGLVKWEHRCTANLLMLLRAMYPEYAAFQAELHAAAAAAVLPRAGGGAGGGTAGGGGGGGGGGCGPSEFVRGTAAWLVLQAVD